MNKLIYAIGIAVAATFSTAAKHQEKVPKQKERTEKHITQQEVVQSDSASVDHKTALKIQS